MALPAQKDQAVPGHLVALHAALQPVSGVMMRHSMAYLGLEVPAAASVAELARLLIAYVEAGALSEAQVRRIINDCREHSNKRAYLFRASPAELARWEPPDRAVVVASRDDARLATSLGTERLGYIWMGGPIIRAGFTEQHTAMLIDFDHNRVEWVPTQRVMVLEANRETGHVTLMVDPPGKRSPHGKTNAYYAYWKGRVAAFFQANLTPFPLITALGKLERERRIRIPFTMLRTAQGKIGMTSIEADDVRDLPQFANLQADRIAHDQDEYVWLPQAPVPPATVGMPLREVKTDIAAVAGEIRFMQHALAGEIDYVLEQLRTNG